MEDTLTVDGIIQRGHQVASGQSPDTPYPGGTIALQAPAFRARGLDLSAYHPATLNVRIAPHRFRLVQPAHHFRDVRWTGAHPPEHFSFARCRLVHGGREVQAWIYYPHPETKARHFGDDQTLEILAPYLPGVSYGDPVRLKLNPAEVEIDPNGASVP